ncbi:MAG: fibrobacter succinogenes major paralogous domain-containing protein [Flavobacteriales bacterium]|nr:fibrobacter succinogenes major paralogous domain-containing protein [Flavobacteriales bacterium]
MTRSVQVAMLCTVVMLGCKKDPEDPTTTDTGTNTEQVGIQQISGTVVLPAGSSIPMGSLEVVTPVQMVNVDTSGSYMTNTIAHVFVTSLVLDGNGELMLMGYNYPGQTDLTISAQSTALALIMNTLPVLHLDDQAKQDLITTLLSDPNLPALVSEIENSLTNNVSFCDTSNAALKQAIIDLFQNGTQQSLFCPDPPVQLYRGGRDVTLVNVSAASYAIGVYRDGTNIQNLELSAPRFFYASVSDVVDGAGTISGDPSQVSFSMDGDGDFEIRMHAGDPTQQGSWAEQHSGLWLNVKDAAVDLTVLLAGALPTGCFSALVQRVTDVVAAVAATNPNISSPADLTAYMIDVYVAVHDGSTNLFEQCAPQASLDPNALTRFFSKIGKVVSLLGKVGTIGTTMNVTARSTHLFLCTSALDTCFTATGNTVMPCGGCGGSSTVTDIDGNVYPIVQIGSQCWLAENLRTSRYRNGDSIPNVTDIGAWPDLNSDAYCNYENNVTYDAIYGKLYNWFAAVDPRHICPLGWHVPTDAEWQQLESTLGMPAAELGNLGLRGVTQNVGGQLKLTALWDTPNTGATNSSGLSASPGGVIGLDGLCQQLGATGKWWSASEYDQEDAWLRGLYYNYASVYRNIAGKPYGFCIRCVRD